MKIMTIYIKNSNSMYGGAYRRYIELINGFLSKGWEVHHISPKGFSNIINHNFYHHNISKIKFKPAYISFMLKTIPKSILIGKNTKIDAFVSFAIFDTFIGLIFRFFFRNTKVIFCDRADSIGGILIEINAKYKNRFLNIFASFLLNNIESFIYKKADLVIFNSNTRRKLVVEKIGIKEGNIKTIYNNANPSWVLNRIKSASSDSFEIKKKWVGKRILSFIGNLYIEGRDLKTLLNSFKMINNELPDTVLLIVGEGPDKEKLVDLINSLGLKESVFLEGWKENPLSYMITSDINIVTGLHEGCSNTILESIFCETVIVGSRVGGITEILKYEELLFDPKDQEELYKKIIKLLKNKNDFKKVQKLLKERKNKLIFDWNKRMINSIEECIDNKKN